MSVFGKLIKNAMVGTVVGTYNIVKEANEKIADQLAEAQLQQAKEDVASYNELMQHLSEKERNEVASMSHRMSLVDMAKRQAKTRNKLAFLESKFKSAEQIEGK